MVIKLSEVGEITFSPTLTYYEIDFVMEDVIQEYLDLRSEAVELLGMPRPRPKHHFLSHFPQAFKKYGPLIKVWAMRMESKHTYFKNILRNVKNFRNVAYTCATRHQLATISYFYYGLFNKSKFEIPDNTINVKETIKIVKDQDLIKFFGKR